MFVCVYTRVGLWGRENRRGCVGLLGELMVRGSVGGANGVGVSWGS